MRKFVVYGFIVIIVEVETNELAFADEILMVSLEG